MNVASLELCRELYRLSAWHDEQPLHPDIIKLVKSGEPQTPIPAYDLGYLLRKLPPNWIRHELQHHLGILTNGEEVVSFVAGYYGHVWFESKTVQVHVHMQQSADTLEDAAAKLAIELFKSGILTKQPEGGAE
jgi:hypothetical protein